jgi:hypothetical protein
MWRDAIVRKLVLGLMVDEKGELGSEEAQAGAKALIEKFEAQIVCRTIILCLTVLVSAGAVEAVLLTLVSPIIAIAATAILIGAILGLVGGAYYARFLRAGV